MADAGVRPRPAVADGFDWRRTLRTCARCWFGALLLVAAFSGLLGVGGGSAVGQLLGLAAVAAVLSTLLVLVAGSLADREMPLGVHLLLAAVGTSLALGVLTWNMAIGAVGAVPGLVAAGLGAAVTAGRPTWRRYAAWLAGAVALGVLVTLA